MNTRRWLEKGSKKVVVRRRLPEELGRRGLWVSPGAALGYWKRDLRRVDGRLLGWAEALVGSGDHVWDVGANVGLFAFSAAVRAGSDGSVLAIEPDPSTCELLHRSLALALPLEAPVVVMHAAVASEDGQELLTLTTSSSMNFVGERPPGVRAEDVGEQITVPTRSLDSLYAESPSAPDLVKIDVEGFEAEVLAGAQRLLAEAHPRIIIEVLAHNAERVTRILSGAGYALHDLEQPTWPVVEVATYSTLALPVESPL